jgi:hypothetical protein
MLAQTSPDPIRGRPFLVMSALIIHARVPQTFFFACFDQRLLKATNTEGLNTFPDKFE